MRAFRPSPTEAESTSEYVVNIEQRLKQAHQILQDQQAHIKLEDKDKPMKSREGDLILLEN